MTCGHSQHVLHRITHHVFQCTACGRVGLYVGGVIYWTKLQTDPLTEQDFVVTETTLFTADATGLAGGEASSDEILSDWKRPQRQAVG